MRLPGSGKPPPAAQPDGAAAAPRKRPLYVRLLHLRHISPTAWQRAALGEGALALAVVLVLADVASAWTLVVLPVAVAAVVKAHDVLAGWLSTGHGQDPATTTAPAPKGTGAVGRRKT